MGQKLFCRLAAVFILSMGLLLGSPILADGDNDSVPLALWNVQVRPGRPYIISIRTCQPRGITQGQILIRRIQRPVLNIERSHVFSDERDGVMEFLDPAASGIFSMFSSEEGAINERHGPFLALLVRSEAGLIPGEVLDLSVIASNTMLVDDDLLEVPFITFDGTITVIEPDAPFLVEVTNLNKGADVRVAPGEEVVVSIGTREFLPLQRAEFVFRYDPQLVRAISVSDLWDYRRDIDVTLDTTTELGVVRMTLDSSRGSINLLPGPLVEFAIEIDEETVVGEAGLLTLDPLETKMFTRRGRTLDLELRSATLTIVPGSSDD